MHTCSSKQQICPRSRGQAETGAKGMGAFCSCCWRRALPLDKALWIKMQQAPSITAKGNTERASSENYAALSRDMLLQLSILHCVADR